jgi:hypothetical protein
MRTEAPPRLRGNEKVFRSFSPQSSKKPFASAISIDVGCIEEVDTKIDGSVESLHGLLVINIAPCPAYRPGTETHCGYFPARSS